MRLSALITAFGAAAMVAADATSVINALSTISNGTIKLNMTAAAFTSKDDLNALFQIYNQSATLLDNIYKAGNISTASSEFNLTEALSLVVPTQMLVNNTLAVLTTLSSKKALFDANKATSLVLSSLKDQKAAADVLSNATVALVPSLARDLARSYTAPLDPAFDAAIAVYSVPASTSGAFPAFSSSAKTAIGLSVLAYMLQL